ncbi:MAG TPA: NAD(P)/FAD-dependent oxidoreductase [Solirubrobacteraceae bacterium]|nr:NAD(P)/FAD-dependent oxidoreductase [Solirubrobacteraceae bacterium]
MAGSEPHRVVIVGGGFAGVRAATRLAKSGAEITLIDRANHHLFQPLLYQVATGLLSEGQVAPALRSMFRSMGAVRTLMGEIEEIDLEGKVVRGHLLEELEVPYDTLVLAAGSEDSYFGHDDWEQWALPMKTLDHAARIRSHILGAFEMAEQEPPGPARDAWLTYAVVGAGPTGVELAGQLSVLTHRVLRDEYRAFDPADRRIILLDAVDEILPSFAPSLQRRAHRDLEKLGVDVRVRHKVVGVDDSGLDAEGPEGHVRISAHTILWSAGVQAAGLAKILGAAAHIELGKGGRVPVGPDLTLAGHPEVFVVGDMADLEGVPGLAPAAIQQGIYAAKVIAARLDGRPAPAPFHYVDKGTLATIGRQRAVADIKGIRFGGPVAFALWAVVHLFYLVGWGNRVGTVTRWLWSLVARNRREQVISVTSLLSDRRVEERVQSRVDDSEPV